MPVTVTFGATGAPQFTLVKLSVSRETQTINNHEADTGGTEMVEHGTLLVDCDKCEARVQAPVVGSYSVFPYGADFASVFSLVKCPECLSPILVGQDELGPDFIDGPFRLYPAKQEKLGPGVPANIEAAFEEGQKCLKGRAYTATAIMCRKAVEGMCRHHGVNEGNLKKDLLKLREKELIETRLYEWADALRVLGNDAAHDIDVTFSRDDVVYILEFTRAILEYVYTFRLKFEKFIERRKAASAQCMLSGPIKEFDAAI